MRPEELETKFDKHATDPGLLVVETADDYDTVDVTPGEPPEIVRRLDTWPELVEASTKRIETLDALLVAYRLDRRPSEKVLTAAPGTEARWQAILAKCTEATDAQA